MFSEKPDFNRSTLTQRTFALGATYIKSVPVQKERQESH